MKKSKKDKTPLDPAMLDDFKATIIFIFMLTLIVGLLAVAMSLNA